MSRWQEEITASVLAEKGTKGKAQVDLAVKGLDEANSNPTFHILLTRRRSWRTAGLFHQGVQDGVQTGEIIDREGRADILLGLRIWSYGLQRLVINLVSYSNSKNKYPLPLDAPRFRCGKILIQSRYSVCDHYGNVWGVWSVSVGGAKALFPQCFQTLVSVREPLFVTNVQDFPL